MIRIAFILLFTCSLCLNAQDSLIYSEHGSFSPKQTVYVYGDYVKLRGEPHSDSKVLDVLNLGEEVLILQKTEVKSVYRERQWNWYKVRFKEKEGFILGALLSLTKLSFEGADYYFSFVGLHGGNRTALEIRTVEGDSIISLLVNLGHIDFKLHLSDNKGLDEVKHILFVDYHGESEGQNYGGVYIFRSEKKLHEVIHLVAYNDGASWACKESLTFPTDPGGLAGGRKGKILYRKEETKYIDLESNWTETVITTRELVWKNEKLNPQVASCR